MNNFNNGMNQNYGYAGGQAQTPVQNFSQEQLMNVQPFVTNQNNNQNGTMM